MSEFEMHVFYIEKLTDVYAHGKIMVFKSETPRRIFGP